MTFEIKFDVTNTISISAVSLWLICKQMFSKKARKQKAMHICGKISLKKANEILLLIDLIGLDVLVFLFFMSQGAVTYDAMRRLVVLGGLVLFQIFQTRDSYRRWREQRWENR